MIFRQILHPATECFLFPAYFAGSACGRAMSGKPSSTIGFERRFNAALRPRSRAEFVAFMLDNLPPPPPEHERIRHANRAGRAPHPSGR